MVNLASLLVPLLVASVCGAGKKPAGSRRVKTAPPASSSTDWAFWFDCLEWLASSIFKGFSEPPKPLQLQGPPPGKALQVAYEVQEPRAQSSWEVYAFALLCLCVLVYCLVQVVLHVLSKLVSIPIALLRSIKTSGPRGGYAAMSAPVVVPEMWADDFGMDLDTFKSLALAMRRFVVEREPARDEANLKAIADLVQGLRPFQQASFWTEISFTSGKFSELDLCSFYEMACFWALEFGSYSVLTEDQYRSGMNTKKRGLVQAASDSVVTKLNVTNRDTYEQWLTRRSKAYHEEVVKEKTKYY